MSFSFRQIFCSLICSLFISFSLFAKCSNVKLPSGCRCTDNYEPVVNLTTKKNYDNPDALRNTSQDVPKSDRPSTLSILCDCQNILKSANPIPNFWFKKNEQNLCVLDYFYGCSPIIFPEGSKTVCEEIGAVKPILPIYSNAKYFPNFCPEGHNLNGFDGANGKFLFFCFEDTYQLKVMVDVVPIPVTNNPLSP